MKADSKSKKSLGEYYSALQLRTDRWSALKIASEQLAESQSERKRTYAENKVVELLDALRPIELYWAFPGHDTFGRLGELVVTGRFDVLAGAVRNICRSLLSNSYRQNPHHHDVDELFEGSPDDDSNEQRGKDLLYFEVLIVDSLSAMQEANLRRTLGAMRRPEDPFVYELVFVPSLTDIRTQPHRCLDRRDVQPQSAGGGGSQRSEARVGADPGTSPPLPVAGRGGPRRH